MCDALAPRTECGVELARCRPAGDCCRFIDVASPADITRSAVLAAGEAVLAQRWREYQRQFLRARRPVRRRVARTNRHLRQRGDLRGGTDRNSPGGPAGTRGCRPPPHVIPVRRSSARGWHLPTTTLSAVRTEAPPTRSRQLAPLHFSLGHHACQVGSRNLRVRRRWRCPWWKSAVRRRLSVSAAGERRFCGLRRPARRSGARLLVVQHQHGRVDVAY